MCNDKKTIYRLNDRISFRKCFLCDGIKESYGDCTNYSQKEENWRTYYCCNQDGIHFHCATHPEIELVRKHDESEELHLKCRYCPDDIVYSSEQQLRNECLQMLNIPSFKDARIIRLDDMYVHEVSVKEKGESGYWVTADVKTDKDGDTIIVLYVGHKDESDKAQFFIKPEKGQLTSDHKDLDPAKILSKIVVQFKGKRISQEYED